jgi:hypothetical protein
MKDDGLHYSVLKHVRTTKCTDVEIVRSMHTPLQENGSILDLPVKCVMMESTMDNQDIVMIPVQEHEAQRFLAAMKSSTMDQ